MFRWSVGTVNGNCVSGSDHIMLTIRDLSKLPTTLALSVIVSLTGIILFVPSAHYLRSDFTPMNISKQCRFWFYPIWGTPQDILSHCPYSVGRLMVFILITSVAGIVQRQTILSSHSLIWTPSVRITSCQRYGKWAAAIAPYRGFLRKAFSGHEANGNTVTSSIDLVSEFFRCSNFQLKIWLTARQVND